jgi:hypothetical protein
MDGVCYTRSGTSYFSAHFASGDIYAVRGTSSGFERSSGTISQLIGSSFVRRGG